MIVILADSANLFALSLAQKSTHPEDTLLAHLVSSDAALSRPSSGICPFQSSFYQSGYICFWPWTLRQMRVTIAARLWPGQRLLQCLLALLLTRRDKTSTCDPAPVELARTYTSVPHPATVLPE